MAMENAEYETISITSFSKSWLINSSTCSERSSSVDGGSSSSSFIEFDPRLPASKRFIQDSNFQFPDPNTPVNQSHAEDIFRNGQILPRTNPILKTASVAASQDIFVSNSSSELTLTSVKCSKNVVSKSVLRKYLSCLRPLFTCRGRVSSNKVAENCGHSVPEMVHRMSVASYSVDCQLRSSSGSDGSIDEAVLHCKRSINKRMSSR